MSRVHSAVSGRSFSPLGLSLFLEARSWDSHHFPSVGLCSTPGHSGPTGEFNSGSPCLPSTGFFIPGSRGWPINWRRHTAIKHTHSRAGASPGSSGIHCSFFFFPLTQRFLCCGSTSSAFLTQCGPAGSTLHLLQVSFSHGLMPATLLKTA